MTGETRLASISRERGEGSHHPKLPGGATLPFLERFVLSPSSRCSILLRQPSPTGDGLPSGPVGTGVGLEPTLARLGIRDLFAVIVTREDVRHGKPAPDLLLLA